MFRYLFIFLCLSLLANGCKDNADIAVEKKEDIIEEVVKSEIPSPKNCEDCHQFSIDPNHSFACTQCHGGNTPSNSEEDAHSNLTAAPSDINNMAAKCQQCHPTHLAKVINSKHFTLADEINLVRKSFGAKKTISGPLAIPVTPTPDSVIALTDDLLRRRCLRCHPYYPGDQYAAVQHGLGCAACHMKFDNGKIVSHKLIKSPDDHICLSCHYGNYVGADYYGLYEHDFNWEYHTPFISSQDKASLYGMKYHQLRPDIHQSAGLACIDCHSGDEVMAITSQKTTCESCHLAVIYTTKETQTRPDNLKLSASSVTLTTKLSGKELAVPQIDDQLHNDNKNISCQVCHAQWSFADTGTHFMRIDHEEYEPWIALTKQGSSEVEQFLEYNLFYDNDQIPPYMSDKFSGENVTGLWLKGFELRRWESIPTCLDENGVLQVCRPILDLHLTYVNSDNKVVFDSANSTAANKGMRPYAPHTIGKAGIFTKMLPGIQNHNSTVK